MTRFLLIVIVAALSACNDSAKVETELDSLGNKIDTLTKTIADSKVADSVKAKGTRLLDSTKSKGGRLIKGLEGKLKDLKNKRDSTK